MKNNNITTFAFVRVAVMAMLFAVMGCVLLSCHQREKREMLEKKKEILEKKKECERILEMERLKYDEPLPISLSEQQKMFMNDNNAFTFLFLKKMDETDKSGKSFLYSPLSITYMLSMVNDAAVGATQSELERTLGFSNGGIQAVNEFCKILINELPKVDLKVHLLVANAIFVNEDYKLKCKFRDEMEEYYKAKAKSFNFASEKNIDRINEWCETNTNGMIPNFIEKLDPQAVSYLLNTIYFQAEWMNKFVAKNTKKGDFATTNGKVKLDMMRQTTHFDYMQNGTFAAVNLPYSNGQWVMTVMLPNKGKNVHDVIDYLATEGSAFLSELECRKVDIKLPRFETNTAVESGDLIGVLKNMGIKRLFDEGTADIPNMCSNNNNVYVSHMLQKAQIKVNEEGSEAAAVTMIMCKKFMLLPPQYDQLVKFYADHPFVYMIRETSSGAILFVGKFTGK